jgi:prepilin signal peptidase PulO-like enzyme (type II secretory pathway)
MIIFAIIFGLITGSFLNAYEYRKRAGKKTVWQGRSFCPKCNHKLGVLDLIPVISYLSLQGRCRYCKKPISTQYPIAEMVTGALFGFVYWHFFPANLGVEAVYKDHNLLLGIISTLFWFYFTAVLILIVISDLKEMIIPDEIILPSIATALVFTIASPFLGSIGGAKFLLGTIGLNLVAGLIGSGLFYLMILISKGKWMGGGDVKLAAFMGLALGWPGVLVALFAAFVLGSIFGISSIALKQKNFADAIPFGPFLAGGTLIAFFWGGPLVSWYLSHLLWL